jgi:DNA repair protein RecO (recombination protein O)
MTLLTTAAVVLRTHRYSETSKIVRLATRDLGVQSAIAKGALRPRSPFGAGIEFLSEGDAQLYFRESRELHTLAAFDVRNLRRALAQDVGRFAAAAALAEVTLKMAPPAPLVAAYDALIAALDRVVLAARETAPAAAVWGLWTLVTQLGFGPALRACVRDDVEIAADRQPVAFSPAEGGVLCPRCAATPNPQDPPTRLPHEDYDALLLLTDPALSLDSRSLPVLDARHAAAHRRLVARFIRHHLDVKSLAALDSWERDWWTLEAPSPPPPVPAAL